MAETQDKSKELASFIWELGERVSRIEDAMTSKASEEERNNNIAKSFGEMVQHYTK